MQTPAPKVISASRRTDLVAWYPDWLADKLEVLGRESIHTVVIWTKNPRNMLLHDRLREALCAQDQVFVHLTITGMGGTAMEPRIPHADEILAILPDLVALCGSPERVVWRFDPILLRQDSAGAHDNLDRFDEIAPVVVSCGIRRVITSICSLYPKVLKRFRSCSDLTPIEPDSDERLGIRRFMADRARETGLELSWCCESGETSARCIDGELLTRLHPRGEGASCNKATGQRPACGCTRSLDIGWYGQLCRSGCLYCYANPVIKQKKTD